MCWLVLLDVPLLVPGKLSLEVTGCARWDCFLSALLCNRRWGGPGAAPFFGVSQFLYPVSCWHWFWSLGTTSGASQSFVDRLCGFFGHVIPSETWQASGLFVQYGSHVGNFCPLVLIKYRRMKAAIFCCVYLPSLSLKEWGCSLAVELAPVCAQDACEMAPMVCRGCSWAGTRSVHRILMSQHPWCAGDTAELAPMCVQDACELAPVVCRGYLRAASHGVQGMLASWLPCVLRMLVSWLPYVHRMIVSWLPWCAGDACELAPMVWENVCELAPMCAQDACELCWSPFLPMVSGCCFSQIHLGYKCIWGCHAHKNLNHCFFSYLLAMNQKYSFLLLFVYELALTWIYLSPSRTD